MNDKEVQEIRLLLGGTVQTTHIAYMLGVSILTEHLRVVHDFLVYGTGAFLERAKNGRTESTRWSAMSDAKELADDAKESILFLQGTGLEILLEDYGLGVSADPLREIFFSYCDHASTCHKHAIKSR